ncbi:DUF308 domain-containing protein [Streptococcus caprae]|uniref:DUF308 domain-containing protein n=1 Tax=Streptococcus caprae TaxID=1640501 RepID=A0ABV8CV77_9STRE
MKRSLILFGLLICLLAFYLFSHPLTPVASIGWIGALVLFYHGALGLRNYIRSSPAYRRPWNLIQSILSLFFAILFLSSSAFSLSTTVFSIVAYWLMFLGGTRLMAAYTYYKANFPDSRREFWSATITILVALFLFINPIFSAAIIGYLFAFIVLLVGISLLLSGLRL